MDYYYSDKLKELIESNRPEDILLDINEVVHKIKGLIMPNAVILHDTIPRKYKKYVQPFKLAAGSFGILQIDTPVMSIWDKLSNQQQPCYRYDEVREVTVCFEEAIEGGKVLYTPSISHPYR